MFPLPVEHCRGLAGDIASFFTVPIGYAYSFKSEGGGHSSSLRSRRNTGTVKQEVSRPFFR